MSLQNAGIVTAPSAFTPTGGTALTFVSAGNFAAGKVTLYVAADTDFRVRRTIDVTVKTPTPQLSTPNGYTQARGKAIFKKPKLLANGKITVNTVTVDVAYDVECTQAEIQELMDVGAQMLVDSDFIPVYKALSLA